MTSFEECPTFTLLIHHHTHQRICFLKQIFFITVAHSPCKRPQWFIGHFIQWALFRFWKKKPAPLRGNSNLENLQLSRHQGLSFLAGHGLQKALRECLPSEFLLMPPASLSCVAISKLLPCPLPSTDTTSLYHGFTTLMTRCPHSLWSPSRSASASRALT